MSKFANRLDALLLVYGIDLMRLQEVSGLYMKGITGRIAVYIFILEVGNLHRVYKCFA